MKNNEEDYEKKYKDALKRVKAMIDVADNQKDAYNCAVTIFPELRLSVDEITVRELLCHLQEAQLYNKITNEQCSRFYDWIQRQRSMFDKIAWHDINENIGIEGGREILCEWHDEYERFVFHDIVYYHPDTNTFDCVDRKISNVTKWIYLDELLPIIKDKNYETDK